MMIMGFRRDPKTKKTFAALVPSTSGVRDGRRAIEVECPRSLLTASPPAQDAWAAALGPDPERHAGVDT